MRQGIDRELAFQRIARPEAHGGRTVSGARASGVVGGAR
jgi:hypothetical protein